jgi:hypothetical protein
MGRVQADGRDPFRLNIDRLLSTNSGMGDVLARLLDEAKGAATKPHGTGASQLDPKRLSPAAWRKFVSLFHHGDPWGPELGPPPGSKGCQVPPKILREFGYPTGASK